MKKIIITAVLAAVLIVGGVAAYVIANSPKSADKSYSAYGSYKDASSSKKLERKVNNKAFSGKDGEVKLKYKQTNNDHDLPLSSRADAYGTYDVYEDENGAEYDYLVNTDLLCYYSTYKGLDPIDSPMSEDSARKIADGLLRENRENGDVYQFISCTYSEYNWTYNICYNIPINGWKTDDDLYIGIKADTGEVKSFGEWNYKRYDNLKLDNGKVQAAKDAGIARIEQILDHRGNRREIEITDSFITLMDDGKPAVKLKYKITSGTSVYGEHYYQVIE